ncbi:MAG: hypothetical protein GY754_25700 [bacterium]|nr:hypothetical protein [bacterium]
MFKRVSIITTVAAAALVFQAGMLMAGGWNKSKGMNKVTITGQLVCLGCSLKKLDGANAQCNLYSHHAIGFKTSDGMLWSIVDNEKGHDIIRAHELLEKKTATITGWIYPAAHFIEIQKVTVKGVSSKKIAQAGWEEDQLIAKRLAERKVGVAPKLAHKH